MAAAPHQPEWRSQLWAASSEPQFADSLCSDADDSIGEEFYLGRIIGVRLTPRTPVAEFSELKPRLHAWPQAENSAPLEPRGSSVYERHYELQNRAGQLRARVALFERPERLLREAVQPQVPGVKRTSEGP